MYFLGTPTGTAGHARERKVSESVLVKGMSIPQPLRSIECPDGLVGLLEVDYRKVEAENCIYKLCLDIIAFQEGRDATWWNRCDLVVVSCKELTVVADSRFS